MSNVFYTYDCDRCSGTGREYESKKTCVNCKGTGHALTELGDQLYDFLTEFMSKVREAERKNK